eukprot:scaffold21887_cov72-Phaeocystis_antarctica.AAC.3
MVSLRRYVPWRELGAVSVPCKHEDDLSLSRGVKQLAYSAHGNSTRRHYPLDSSQRVNAARRVSL